MKLYLKILFGAAVVITSVSCKSEFEALLGSGDVDAKYNAAFEYFNNRKYNKAASLFEALSVQTAGTERDDTVRYYWGLSNYRFKDYYTAEANFARFIESYPRSPFASEARFLRLDCLYRSTLRYELDQVPTHRAMEAIGEYLREYPESDRVDACNEMIGELQTRLDTKAFEGARLYYHMEDYLASRVAFRNILKDNSENCFREDILYYTAMSSYKYAKLSVQRKQKERYLVFVDDYLNFIGESPESKYRKELDVMYRRAMKAIGREVVETDEDGYRRDSKFEKERNKIERAARKMARQKNETLSKNKGIN